jgi:hypothetical protein
MTTTSIQYNKCSILVTNSGAVTTSTFNSTVLSRADIGLVSKILKLEALNYPVRWFMILKLYNKIKDPTYSAPILDIVHINRRVLIHRGRRVTTLIPSFKMSLAGVTSTPVCLVLQYCPHTTREVGRPPGMTFTCCLDLGWKM